MNIDTIIDKIIHWEDGFDRLAKYFNNEDYATIMDETRWYDEDILVYYETAFRDEDWYACLSLYLEDWLKEQICSRTKSGTENLFRLWFESV